MDLFRLKSSTIGGGFFKCINIPPDNIIIKTRNILKKDIRRLSNTDNKRNQSRWLRRISHLPLCMLESKTSEVVVLFLSLFCLAVCTSNSFR